MVANRRQEREDLGKPARLNETLCPILRFLPRRVADRGRLRGTSARGKQDQQ
jgi:hypothetical protein